MAAGAIAALNDALRQTGQGGRIVITAGVAALGEGFVDQAVAAVRAFSTFDAANDPHGEHDFGLVEIDGQTVYWKIDYYDQALAGHSPDPADPSLTVRVLTILLACEY